MCLVAQTFFWLLKASKFFCLCVGDTNARSSSSSTTGEEELGNFILFFFVIGLCSYRCSEEEGLILCFGLWDANVTSSIGVL